VHAYQAAIRVLSIWVEPTSSTVVGQEGMEVVNTPEGLEAYAELTSSPVKGIEGTSEVSVPVTKKKIMTRKAPKLR